MKVHQRTDYSSAVQLRSLAASVVVCLAGMAMPGLAWATQPVTPTPQVVGFRPEARNVSLNKSSMFVDEVVYVNYQYYDKDGDKQAAPTISWIMNGAPSVQNKNQQSAAPSGYSNTPEGVICKNFSLAADVTANSIGGVPSGGSAQRSPAITVSYHNIPGFVVADAVVLNQVDAWNYCLAKGMKLPNPYQLQDVFNKYTPRGQGIATNPNADDYTLATKYGWPLLGMCGGTSGGYWTGNGVDSYSHYMVYMLNGNIQPANNNLRLQVACVP